MSLAKRMKGVMQTLRYQAELTPKVLHRDMLALRKLDRHHEGRQLWFLRAAWLLGLPSLAAVAYTVAFTLGDNARFLLFFVIFLLSLGLQWWRARASSTLQPAREAPAAKYLAPAAGVGLTVLLYLVGQELAWSEAVYAFLGLAGGTVSAWLLWSYQRHARMNLEDRRYELVKELLVVLARDMDRARPLSCELALAPADAPDNMLDRSSVGLWTVRRYRDDWLQLAGRFLDGTRFKLRWTDKVKTKTRSKSKGRVKKKRKDKAAVSLELRVKPSKFPHLAHVKADKRVVQLPTDARLASIDVQPDGVSLEVLPDEGWRAGAAEGDTTPGVELVSRMFLAGYQVLNLAKQLRKRG